MSQLGRVSTAARVFTLAALSSICIVSGIGFQGLGLVAVVAIFAQTLEPTRRVPEHIVAVIEGALAATVIVLAYPANEAALPYLAIPVLIGGLAHGFRGVLMVTGAEALLLTANWYSWVGTYDQRMFAGAFTWIVTGVGIGLMGALVRNSFLSSGVGASYRDALGLIKQLHALSGKLTSGLDPVSIAEEILARASSLLVISHSAVLVRSPSGSFSPLRYGEGATGAHPRTGNDLAEQAWTTGHAVLQDRAFAIPLATESQVVAVLIAECAGIPEDVDIEELVDLLAPDAVMLSAALLFTDVRNSATSEERQRLAREVHDGVAQDVASLGYLVDNLAATAVDADQRAQFSALRGEVSRVVGELRNSVFDLRNEAAAGQGLGQSIASFARHIGSHSPLTIHVTLDESTVRLLPEVEAELLRISQEAINNARRHSGGTNLWVSCTVRPPYAEIEVIDDGDGLGAGRSDSHGLRIMRERASRIDAALEVVSPAAKGRGTRLCVKLDPAAATV